MIICDNMVDPKGIIPGEISQTKTNAVWFHLHMEYKNNNPPQTTKLMEKEIRFVISRGRG